MSDTNYRSTVLSGANIADEHICCAIGNDAVNRDRAERKRAWLRAQFGHGHTFRKIDVRGKVFIEYMPAEYAWFPIVAPGYTFVQCFWVSGRYKGQGLGARLLAECEADVADSRGLVAVSSDRKRPFMVDKRFLVKYGFRVCDTAHPYFELLVRNFGGSADGAEPHFLDSARSGRIEGVSGLDFFYTDACPFNSDFVQELAAIGRERGLEVRIHHTASLEDVAKLPVAWGTYALFCNGSFVDHAITPPKSFPALLDSLGV